MSAKRGKKTCGPHGAYELNVLEDERKNKRHIYRCVRRETYAGFVGQMDGLFGVVYMQSSIKLAYQKD